MQRHVLFGSLAAFAVLAPRAPGHAGSFPVDVSPALLTRLVGVPLASTAPSTTRVSVASNGTQGNKASYAYSISADGRYVAFTSDATNLVPGDTNRCTDVFVHDRQTGQTTRVSVNSAGDQGDDLSDWPSLTADGRYVAFGSWANNLVPGDTKRCKDVFVHDRQTGHMTLVSVDSAGKQGNDYSYTPSLSADGRYVAFVSDATNLVPGDSNRASDVFVHDLQTGQTSRMSVDSAGKQGNGNSYTPSVSADGRCVAFVSYATNLVPGDTSYVYDVFVRDRQTGQTVRASVDSAGNEASNISDEPALSADGRFVAFSSCATNLVTGDTNASWDIFLHDLQTGHTTRVSADPAGEQGSDDSYTPSLSADGRYVTFVSYATNLVPGDTNDACDVFVRDWRTGQTTRVSVDSAGLQGDKNSYTPCLSADGRHVTFCSLAANLVPGDSNGKRDVFVHDCGTSYQPDLMVRNLGATAYAGNNVYSSTGPSQKRTQAVAAGATATYQLQVQNDSTEPDSFTLHGTAGDNVWEVRYFDRATGGTDITTQVTGIGWQTATLGAGSKRGLRVEVKAGATATSGAKKAVLVKAASVANPAAEDAVKAVSTVEAAAGPLAICGLSVLPTQTGAEIVLSLTARTHLDVRLLSVTGRPVRTLCSGQACEAGTQRLVWNAQSDAGLPVPGGVYLVQVAACGTDGTRSQALTRLVLTRR